MPATSFLDGLNPPQQQAVQHRTGPALVLAGPGSGKTRVLIHRIGMLMSTGVEPQHILAVTFTNKAAREMRERLAALIGEVRARQVTAATFHSLCARWLRKTIHLLGREQNFTIIDDDDQLKILRGVLERLNSDLEARNARREIGRYKTALWTVEIVANRAQAEEGLQEWLPVYAAYEEELARQNALDFDDLLLYMIRVFEQSSRTLHRFQVQYAYILNDEYQDAAPATYRLLQLLAARHRNLFVVGDDNQAIYGFRGSTPEFIRRFQQEYAEATIIMLEQNYRSTGAIVALAEAVITASDEHIYDKHLWTANPTGNLAIGTVVFDERAEAATIVHLITEAREHGTALRDIAIIYRTNVQSRPIEQALVRAGIPYQLVGGTPFFERAEVRDILAYLRVAANRQDDLSLMRVFNVPGRSVGDKTLRALETAARRHGCSLRDLVASAHITLDADLFMQPVRYTLPTLHQAAQRGVAQLADVLHWLDTVATTTPLDEVITLLIKRIDYYTHLVKVYGPGAADARLENVMELVSVAVGLRDLSVVEQLRQFLEDVALMTDADRRDDPNSVTCITFHRAKGLEWDMTILPGVEDDLLPHANAQASTAEIEEERRLFYVGVSRARKRLYLLHTHERTIYGTTRDCARSRFLELLPPGHVQWI